MHLAAAIVHFESVDWLLLLRGHAHLSFYRSSAHREITTIICQSFIDMFVEWTKRLHLCEFNIFIALFNFIWTCDIWPMIDQPEADQEVPSELLPSWGSTYSLLDCHFVLKKLRFFHGWNTSIEIKNHLKVDKQTLKHLTVLGDQAEKLTGSWNKKNKTRVQLRSKKGPHCTWFIQRDVGQGLWMQERISSRCYGTLLVRR